MATPYVLIERNVVPSTQDLAEAEQRKARRPVLVVAAKQTAGRGRTGNSWWQAPGGVAASLALDVAAIHELGTLTLAVGLAVRNAVEEATGIATDLKWPNDIERNGQKVGGVLVERRDSVVIIGCGLNLFWPYPPHGAGSLFADEPAAYVGCDISGAWANEIIATRGRWDRDTYESACSTLGERITWEPGGEGLAEGVADDGGLVVATADGPVTLYSGEVRTVRASGDA